MRSHAQTQRSFKQWRLCGSGKNRALLLGVSQLGREGGFQVDSEGSLLFQQLILLQEHLGSFFLLSSACKLSGIGRGHVWWRYTLNNGFGGELDWSKGHGSFDL